MSEEKKDKNGIPLGMNVSPTDKTKTEQNPTQRIDISNVIANGDVNASISNSDSTPKKSMTGLILGIIVLICVAVCYIAYLYLNKK